jgi:DNA-binding response OmpR family regulator
MEARLLVVGETSCVATSWIESLVSAGAVVETVPNGPEALRRLEHLDPDVVLLDVYLAGPLDGFETCRGIRALSDTLVVFVAAHAEPYDEVVALAVGGDHYFACGTPVPIVIARLRSLLRRARGTVVLQGEVTEVPAERIESGRASAFITEPTPQVMMASMGHGSEDPWQREAAAERVAPSPSSAASAAAHESLVDGDLEIDVVAREVRVCGEPVLLTRIEFDLLVTLASQPRRVFTREQLLASVWDVSFDGSHVLDSHMSRLRRKIDEAGGQRVAFAVRGVGFRLRG